MLIKEEASLDIIQVVVILYIIPDQEDLEPPIYNEDPGTVHGKYILYNDKLFQLHDNAGDGLCLLDSVSSFFCNVYSTAPEAIVCRPNFFYNNHEMGYDLPHVVQFLLEFLCALSKKDFDAILIDYQDGDNPPEPTLSSEYKKFTKQIGHDIKLSPMEDGKQEEVVKWMKLFIFYKLNKFIIGNREMPFLDEKHALALSKAHKIQFVIISLI
jgi:hypothetical protein